VLGGQQLTCQCRLTNTAISENHNAYVGRHPLLYRIAIWNLRRRRLGRGIVWRQIFGGGCSGAANIRGSIVRERQMSGARDCAGANVCRGQMCKLGVDITRACTASVSATSVDEDFAEALYGGKYSRSTSRGELSVTRQLSGG